MVWKTPQKFSAQSPVPSTPTPTPTPPATGSVRQPLIEAAISRLKKISVGALEVDRLPATGQVRYLSANGDGIFAAPFGGDPRQFVRAFLAQADTAAAFSLAGFNLVDGETVVSNMGTNLLFHQFASIPGYDKPLRVREGVVSALVDKAGHLVLMHNGVRTGCLPKRTCKIVSQEQAVMAAKVHYARGDATLVSCELVLSPHEVKKGKRIVKKKGEPVVRLDPTYEMILTAKKPDSAMVYLVDGKTGAVVYTREKIRHMSQVSKRQQAAQNPACKLFPVTPDAHKPLPQQIIDYTIAGLDDPTKLDSADLECRILDKSGAWVTATAKSDGTWNYGPSDPEFGAVQSFVAVKTMLDLQKKLGLQGWHKIVGYIGDPAVTDNAYLDPQGWQYRIGIGSGAGGLRHDISFDLMVSNHEVNGHGGITVGTPGHDLPGDEGSAEHEKGGDMMALSAEYLRHVLFASILKQPFGLVEVSKDGRIIGPYSIDGGIRVLRNTKQYPGDITGEPHDDSLIPGGACGDLLEAMINAENDVVKGCEAYVTLQIGAWRNVPVHKVLFVDMLRAFKAADQTLFSGKYWSMIEKAHKDHGIVLPSAQTRTPKKRKPKGKKRTPRNRRRRAA
jgi:hypothetical protein